MAHASQFLQRRLGFQMIMYFYVSTIGNEMDGDSSALVLKDPHPVHCKAIHKGGSSGF
jgi:hypothetical protein